MVPRIDYLWCGPVTSLVGIAVHTRGAAINTTHSMAVVIKLTPMTFPRRKSTILAVRVIRTVLLTSTILGGERRRWQRRFQTCTTTTTRRVCAGCPYEATVRRRTGMTGAVESTPMAFDRGIVVAGIA
jgi:hypothetical protein